VTARPAAAVRAVVLPRLVVAAAARQRGFKRKNVNFVNYWQRTKIISEVWGELLDGECYGEAKW